MSNKNDNKSLFLYTALIFAVAVLLIILSFFGQTNMQKNQPRVDEGVQKEQPLFGITEKAALLSEENTVLLNENKTLAEENLRLKSENEAMLQKQTINDSLLSANAYFKLGNKEKAIEILKMLNYDELTEDQKIIYDNINN